MHGKLWELLERGLRDMKIPRPVVRAVSPQRKSMCGAEFEDDDLLYNGKTSESKADGNDAFSVLEEEEDYDPVFAALEDESCGSEVDSDLLEDDVERIVKYEKEGIKENVCQAWATQGSNLEDVDLCSLLEEEEFGVADGPDHFYALLGQDETMLEEVCHVSHDQFMPI